MGQKVETSLLESTICFLGLSMTQYLFSGEVPSMRSRIKTAGVYALVAGDGKPFVIHLSHPPKFWIGVTEVMGRPDFQTDERTKDRPARAQNYDFISETFGAVVQSAPREHWLAELRARDVPCAPLNNFAEVFEDPQVKHLDRLLDVDHPEFGPLQAGAQRPQPAGHSHHPEAPAPDTRRAQRGDPRRAGLHPRGNTLLQGKKHRMTGAAPRSHGRFS